MEHGVLFGLRCNNICTYVLSGCLFSLKIPVSGWKPIETEAVVHLPSEQQ